MDGGREGGREGEGERLAQTNYRNCAFGVVPKQKGKYIYKTLYSGSKTTDVPRLSPLGDHMTIKYDNVDQSWQAVERRPGQILERHDLAEDNTR